ncbi:GNAT family N-acetyltransferase [Actinomyces sp. ZJ308]|uniref:GNAT family N-acetyltransferase n=1 Tax=Actinomyces sp. ZJ308 TaxID=2708342 RepID=UPI00141D9B79|nr:GNAT family N-acetyltransferase [Actinomyces sp. ZJ308]
MRTRRIRLAGATDRWARDLFRRAFPEEERLPWGLIHLLSLRRGVDLVAWWDESSTWPGGAGPSGPVWQTDPSALTWTVRRPGSRLLYLFYLAVDDAARGRGLGTRLLAELERRHPGCSIVLDIEPVVAEADNAEQRRRRLAFYERAGFRDTGYAVIDSMGEYWTLVREAPGTRFRPEEFRAALRYLDCGLSSARLIPRD